ncbi:spore germination protein (amino acid permease) [Bacillus niacini]|jgi:spore germination protein (amino acid permease)|uniref:Spore germination protein (Amino acid permease) n=1 Tax=Neobacillus niacini TaxID=86668 RepID=A0A852T876_9BACI|nr:GerAB/ArcD/ProY family transporter [Neobacillus niacini]NYE04009.1 spore germination protein (amino acid permease) [Neobacillus niacini]
MKVQYQAKPQYILSTFILFFIIHSIQVGIGIQGFQRIIFSEAKNDSWISVVLAGVFTHIVVFFIIKTLQLYGPTDIYGIHIEVYGKWIGKAVNCIYIFYCLGMFVVILNNYIEVIQTWVFPTVPTWLFSISILLLVVYGVTGGIRVIAGAGFFSIILSVWILSFIGYPLRFVDFHHLLPVMESNITSILKGSYKMTITLIGFEILYIVYPFMEDRKKVIKYAHLGVAATNILYLILMLLTLSYFSPGQLENTNWPTLSLFKIVKLPFIERTEYVAVSYWLLIILPNLLLYMWAAVRGIKRSFERKTKGVIWFFTIFLFFVSIFINTRSKINQFNDFFDNIAFYIAFCYPFILYILALIKKKMTSLKEN